MGALLVESLAIGSAPIPDSQLVGWLLGIYTVAAHCGRTAAAIGGAVSLAAGLVVAVRERGGGGELHARSRALLNHEAAHE